MSIYDTLASAAVNVLKTFKNPQTIDHQQETLTPDAGGGYSSSWVSVSTGIECAVIPLTGQERSVAQRLNYEATHAVYMTYANGSAIQPEDRLLFGSRVFEVVDPRNVGEANAVMRIICLEGK